MRSIIALLLALQVSDVTPSVANASLRAVAPSMIQQHDGKSATTNNGRSIEQPAESIPGNGKNSNSPTSMVEDPWCAECYFTFTVPTSSEPGYYGITWGFLEFGVDDYCEPYSMQTCVTCYDVENIYGIDEATCWDKAPCGVANCSIDQEFEPGPEEAFWNWEESYGCLSNDYDNVCNGASNEFAQAYAANAAAKTLLRIIDESDGDLFINWERGTVQGKGCGGGIGLNLQLTQGMRDQLNSPLWSFTAALIMGLVGVAVVRQEQDP